LAQVTEIVTDKGELRLRGIDAFDPADAFHRLVLKNIASQAIDGIGGIYDHPSVQQAFDDRLYIPGLWIHRV
jgi:hypothetical protein